MRSVCITHYQRTSSVLGTYAAYVKRVKNVLSVCTTYAYRIGQRSGFYVKNGREGARWRSGRASDSESRGPGIDPHRRHRGVSLSKTN